MSTTQNRVRIARRRATRQGLRLTQAGHIFTLTDPASGATLALGPLNLIDTYLLQRRAHRPPGPSPTTCPPPEWKPLLDEYALTLTAAGQSDATIRLRFFQLCRIARGLRCPPEQVDAATLVNWFGRQQHWTNNGGRKSYRAAAVGFFGWAHRLGRLPTNPAAALPAVREHPTTPRPVDDDAWGAALAGADQRTRLMLRLAAEAGLRRAEVAQIHTRDLLDHPDAPALLVHGKGGKERVVPLSQELAGMVRLGAAGHTPGAPVPGWLFPNMLGGHVSAEHVGKLVARALPGGWSMHHLRHRFATRAYRGSRNLRAVQTLLGHASVATTQRYTGLASDELREAAACAW